MISQGFKAKTEDILAFASDLANTISSEPGKSCLDLDDEIRNQLDQKLEYLSLLTASPSPLIRRQLDQEGTKLWNTCMQLMTIHREKEQLVLLCKVCTVKAFAFAMLEYAAPNNGQGRALEVAFIMATTCIDCGCLDISQKIIETAALRLDRLERVESNVEEFKLQQYTVEYYMLRVYLSWFQKRLDIADHLFSKIPASNNEKGQELVMDICYKIGNSALSRKQYDVSAKWLGRALSAFRASLYLDTDEFKDYFTRMLNALRTRYSGLFHTKVIELENLSREEPNGDAYLQGCWIYSLQ
ncbi:hypothetical protein BO94DRAFT_555764 [Aspergillus sclerotioniger CBS 115572]|uniref:Protein ZIP4 homolog n=1 Tax=Aspergillus sclerotioniger CBS 115572 TaxID=1450535 RepID=A0A317WX76_9EURO|nr:hypothetical protein BO94DRAFT_555764 [Aspergillus sclerotioniger CBS 115572]PWY89398.1 hypothetical protein BO94DRAFT_555764 [Aspergillus sclerotioniger CBS 115572]